LIWHLPPRSYITFYGDTILSFEVNLNYSRAYKTLDEKVGESSAQEEFPQLKELHEYN